ncbi:endothelin-converting enzyme 1-like [Rhipicephalus microplus]|uniref:endothelin-converting enzyme 1-like n=1 Tax=Rhipicephalus microplus TaxID=6941 RepID=UPI003F6B7B22
MGTPAMLFAPFLVEDAPVAVNYGAIGGIVGSLLAQSLDPSVGAYDILGRRMEQSWFSEASLNARKYTLSCISTNMETYLKDSLSDDHATEVLAYTMGLRFAHAAFLRKLDDNDTLMAAGEWDGPFLSGSDVRGLNRLFFAASCFQLCGVSLPRGVATSALPLRHRCNMPLMNYAEFGRAFGCPAHSAMVATNSCFPEP